MHPCKHPGCNALLNASGYCDAHQSSAPKRGAAYQQWRQSNTQQRAVDDIRNSPAWRKIRKIKLASNPLCEDPFSIHARHGSTESAKQVHHIKGLASHPELAYQWGNLMSVCYQCHARIEVAPSE